MATFDQFVAAGEKVRNWGRWGAADRIGTLNHITPQRSRDAARLVKKGMNFPLGTDLRTPLYGNSQMRQNAIYSVNINAGGNVEKFLSHLERWNGPGAQEVASLARIAKHPAIFAEDYLHLPLQCTSQWDGLCHLSYDGHVYNGHSADCITCLGATELGIEYMARHGVVGRGVLLDIPRYRKVSFLPACSPVLPEELDAVVKAQNVEIRDGDIILIRTGWWHNRAEIGGAMHAPGLGWECAMWLHARDVAAVASDNPAVEVIEFTTPQKQVDDVSLPLHILCLRDMGMMLGELWDFDALAQDCAEDGVYEFMLAAPPLNISGGLGSPVNPVAIK